MKTVQELYGEIVASDELDEHFAIPLHDGMAVGDALLVYVVVSGLLGFIWSTMKQ